MRSIQLDFPVKDFNGYDFAYKIRAGYLLSDMFSQVGSSTFFITFNFVVKSLNLINKARFIYSSGMCNETEIMDIIESFIDDQKAFRALKHPPNSHFLAFKRMESAFDKLLKEWSLSFRLSLSKHGYDGLMELCCDNHFLISHYDDSSVIENMAIVSPIDLLTNKLTRPNTDNAVWLMPQKFYSEQYFETWVVTKIEEIEVDVPYFIKCFDLPNLNILTSTELSSIKKQITNLITPFKTEVEKLATLCYQSDGNSQFINIVLPTMAGLQATIDKNEIIKHLKSTPAGCISAPIYMGEISPLILWKYYFEMNVLDEPTYEGLIKDYDSVPNYSVPIMLFTSPQDGLVLGLNIDLDEESETVDKIVSSNKKHINID